MPRLPVNVANTAWSHLWSSINKYKTICIKNRNYKAILKVNSHFDKHWKSWLFFSVSLASVWALVLLNGQCSVKNTMFRARTEQENRLSNKRVLSILDKDGGSARSWAGPGPAPDGSSCVCSNWFGCRLRPPGFSALPCSARRTRGMLRIKGKCFQSDPCTAEDREGASGATESLQKSAYKLILQLRRNMGGGPPTIHTCPPPIWTCHPGITAEPETSLKEGTFPDSWCCPEEIFKNPPIC